MQEWNIKFGGQGHAYCAQNQTQLLQYFMYLRINHVQNCHIASFPILDERIAKIINVCIWQFFFILSLLIEGDLNDWMLFQTFILDLTKTNLIYLFVNLGII